MAKKSFQRAGCVICFLKGKGGNEAGTAIIYAPNIQNMAKKLPQKNAEMG